MFVDLDMFKLLYHNILFLVIFMPYYSCYILFKIITQWHKFIFEFFVVLISSFSIFSSMLLKSNFFFAIWILKGFLVFSMLPKKEQKLSVSFKDWRHQKDVSKLTDHYRWKILRSTNPRTPKTGNCFELLSDWLLSYYESQWEGSSKQLLYIEPGFGVPGFLLLKLCYL